MTTATNRLAVGLVCLWMATAPAHAEIIGNWDFSTGSLTPQSATTGMSLTWLPNTGIYSAFGGSPNPPGLAYGTTSDFGIAALGDFSGSVMKVPDMSGLGPAVGLMATFPLRANGTNADGSAATRLNRYSLVMDVLVPSVSFGGSKSHINLFEPRGGTDGSLFVREPSRQIGAATGYSPDNAFQPDTWYRIAMVMKLDEASNVPRYETYLNGGKVAEIISDNIVISTDRDATLKDADLVVDGNWSLGSLYDSDPSLKDKSTSAFFLFTDNNDELGQLYIANLQFRDNAMSSSDVAALGYATGGIIAVPEPRTLLLAAAGVAAMALTRGFRKRTRGRS